MTPETLNPSTLFLSNYKGKNVLLPQDITDALNAEIADKRLLSVQSLSECVDMMVRFAGLAPQPVDLWGITFRSIPGQYLLIDLTGAVHEIQCRKSDAGWSFYHSPEHGWVNHEYCARVFGAGKPDSLAA